MAVLTNDLVSDGTISNKVVVLDPTAPHRAGDPDPGPPAGKLKGKTVLFRVDPLWRSWDWTVDEWSKSLRDAGATVVTYERWQGVVTGEEGRRAQAEYEALINSADLVISGLANCGSCTAWTIRDALTALATGIPTMAAVTAHFVPLAKALADSAWRPGLRLHVLPYPYDHLEESEVRQIARDHFDSMLVNIGAEV